MASESVSTQLQQASASIDSVAAIVRTFIDPEDHVAAAAIGRQAFCLADLLERISNDLDKVAWQMREFVAPKEETADISR